ncbi:MAG: AMP-binding protein, partial [Saprospiraceae bacterium]|nr:AMP-binding protein [Saprospiraceae bacterium]
MLETLAGACDSNRGITFVFGVNSEQDLSYRKLYARALGFLSELRKHGLQAGDQLILLSNDYPVFITAFWGAQLGGIVPVPVAVGINDQQRAKVFQIFTTLERGYVLTTSDTVARLQQYATMHGMEAVLEQVLAKTVVTDMVSSENDGIDIELHNVEPEDVALIQFSSGSTSDPKGVVLTHSNILCNIRSITAGAAHTADDISLGWMPLTHDMGLIGFHLSMMACGMQQILMTTDLFSRRPILWLSKASEHKATVLCSPNFGYKHYLKALGDKIPDNLDLSAVRLIYNGAEPISVDLCEQFLQTMQPYGLRRNTMFTVYGLAEATLVVAFPPLGEEYRSVYVDRH